ncbi:hypothetical protein [Mesobacillus stamsii]|uniref:RNase H type-1 domain-containing protein n=1 Tax=Mesobacillus stamsii TaxID=225347 RepID=A0ABU0FYK1_9BACI|nr:hypothetical protein [Mesobacillus stamsii]MDQ0414989.1 hypothetical protein [Mesobacillus stamsii]
MKSKGNSKRVEDLNFWTGFEDNVPQEIRDLIFEQYLGEDLYVYCDASIKNRLQSVACIFVHNASTVLIKKMVYPPPDCLDKSFFGEMGAVVYALKNFSKHMMPSCKSVTICSDVSSMEQWVDGRASFKNHNLQKMQNEMILLYEKVKLQNPDISIEVKYLLEEHKNYHPFYKAVHNAARSVLRRNR